MRRTRAQLAEDRRILLEAVRADAPEQARMSGPLRVLSYGGGKDSTALGILNATGRIENPATVCLFADTGTEHPDTYGYVANVFQPWAESHGLEVVTVRSNYGGGSVYADNWRRRDVPSIISRVCTNMFKVRPMQLWHRAHGATRQNPADVQIAITADESHRAKRHKRDPLYLQKRWPLVDLRLTRQDCRRIIAEAGLPEPPKSSCTICAFHSRAYWLRLQREYPTTFTAALELENRARERNPRISIGSDKPLSRLIGEGRQVGFDEFLEAEFSCRSGECGV